MTKAQVIAEHHEQRGNAYHKLVQYRDTPADLAKLLVRHPTEGATTRGERS